MRIDDNIFIDFSRCPLQRCDQKKEVHMKYEKSCGAIVFKQIQDEYRFLIIQHRGGHWGFPKGHVEKGETERQTAIREVYEETGLEIEIYDGFRETIQYSPRSDIVKTVVFFLAQAITDEVQYILPEVVDHAWITSREATTRLGYENQQNLVTQAYNYLT